MNVVDHFNDDNDENNFPHKYFLISTQVSRLCKAFGIGSLANIKLSKTQLHKIGESGGFGLSLIGNVLKALAKRVLISLRSTSAASSTDNDENNFPHENVWSWHALTC